MANCSSCSLQRILSGYTLVLLVAAIGLAETRVVVPNSNANRDGDASAPDDFAGAFRVSGSV